MSTPQTRTDDDFDHKVGTVGRVSTPGDPRGPGDRGTRSSGEPGEFCTKGLFGDARLLGRAREDGRGDRRRQMRTGDLAVAWTPTGYMSGSPADQDMVIRGGENIYPREIEEFLYTHPDIVDAQVIGVPDVKYGELCAWIRMHEGG